MLKIGLIKINELYTHDILPDPTAISALARILRLVILSRLYVRLVRTCLVLVCLLFSSFLLFSSIACIFRYSSPYLIVRTSVDSSIISIAGISELTFLFCEISGINLDWNLFHFSTVAPSFVSNQVLWVRHSAVG